MADNILISSYQNPVKFVRSGYSNPAPYNTKYFDDFIFGETIKDFEEQVEYLQPWQKNDIIYLQFLSNYSPFNIKVMKCDGTEVQSLSPAYVASSTEISGLKCYEVAIALNSYDEGIYQLILLCGDFPYIDTLESEWFHIKTKHENSIQLRYKHEENDFDIAFETGIEFQYRVHGAVEQEFQPGSNRSVFIDQSEGAVQLKNKAFYTTKLVIGDEFGVPNWVPQRISEIQRCSSVLYDGKEFVVADGAKFEPTRESLYPKVGWQIEIREKDKKSSKRFVATGESVNDTSVVYNIEARGFGAISGEASSNVLQIESLD